MGLVGVSVGDVGLKVMVGEELEGAAVGTVGDAEVTGKPTHITVPGPDGHVLAVRG